ncbi:MAG: pucA [Sediminibacterium sp.]|nr:pucA [Sediminibacterium sp.]
MKEVNDIVRSFHTAQQQGIKTALATVVKVEGSSYRQAGARMLVTETGQLTGAISGGCLEGDALRRALLAIEQQQNKLVTYDTSNEDDIEFGVQLGCNGIVHILFEPIKSAEADNPIVLLEQLLKQREKAVVVTIFSLNRMQEQVGTRMLFREHNELIQDPAVALKQDVAAAFENGRSAVTQFLFNGQTVEVLIDFIPPPVKLIIAGAGNDVQPLVEMASLLGWDTVVADGRKTHATSKRFPKATEVLVAKPGALAEAIVADRYTMVLLMTHNYNYDLELLKLLLDKDLPYIGILGPKKKFERMLGDLSKMNVIITEAQMNNIYAPIGHDIGAETAEEIAVSIIAEIKAVLTGRKGASLKFKEGKIHV